MNQQIVGLIQPLHIGDVYGTFSKILYFLACLIATSLPITGIIIWLNKLQKKSKRKAPKVTVERRSARRIAVADPQPEPVVAASGQALS